MNSPRFPHLACEKRLEKAEDHILNLESALNDVLELIEMDPEANDPSKDLYSVVLAAKIVLDPSLMGVPSVAVPEVPYRPCTIHGGYDPSLKQCPGCLDAKLVEAPRTSEASPAVGSRLWRCEQELAKAREQLQTIRNFVTEAPFPKGMYLIDKGHVDAIPEPLPKGFTSDERNASDLIAPADPRTKDPLPKPRCERTDGHSCPYGTVDHPPRTNEAVLPIGDPRRLDPCWRCSHERRCHEDGACVYGAASGPGQRCACCGFVEARTDSASPADECRSPYFCRRKPGHRGPHRRTPDEPSHLPDQRGLKRIADDGGEASQAEVEAMAAALLETRQRTEPAKAKAWKGKSEDGSVGFDLEHNGGSLGQVTFASDGTVEIVITKSEPRTETALVREDWSDIANGREEGDDWPPLRVTQATAKARSEERERLAKELLFYADQLTGNGQMRHPIGGDCIDTAARAIARWLRKGGKEWETPTVTGGGA